MRGKGKSEKGGQGMRGEKGREEERQRYQTGCDDIGVSAHNSKQKTIQSQQITTKNQIALLCEKQYTLGLQQ